MPFLPIDNLPGKGKFRPKPVLPPVRGGDRRRGAFPCLALRALDHGSDLYRALVVKRPLISRDRSRAEDRLPATHRGRVRRCSVACRSAPSFRDLAADYPAKHGIPLASGPGWRLRRPSVRAVEQGAGLVLRVRRDVVGAAGHGAGLAALPSSSGSADAGSGHAEFLLSIVTVTFPGMIRGEPAMGRRT